MVGAGEFLEKVSVLTPFPACCPGVTLTSSCPHLCKAFLELASFRFLKPTIGVCPHNGKPSAAASLPGIQCLGLCMGFIYSLTSVSMGRAAKLNGLLGCRDHHGLWAVAQLGSQWSKGILGWWGEVVHLVMGVAQRKHLSLPSLPAPALFLAVSSHTMAVFYL